MAKIKSFFTNWWTVSVLITVLLLLVFGLGLPLVAAPFRIWWVRWPLVALILGVWGLLAFLRVRSQKKAQAELADGIAQSAGAGANDGEQRLQAERMAEALASLKTASGKRKGYLYSRPWYVIIGPPGAGKTTALENSGLRFPFSDQAMKGVGGTRNLDFMFADEAVLIDTAGRYTSQDSDAAADSKAWHSFLGLLKRNRPLQPVNGILVAIGADELLKADRAQIDAHAGAIRRRLMEVRAGLEVAAPVYFMITKADLIAGFIEFFEDLDVEGRRAVLGHTFSFAKGLPKTEDITFAFDDISQAISDRQAKRLSEENDAMRRSLILGFPAQVNTLRSRLVRLIEGAFPANDVPGGVLRGVYLTSGVQNGAPLDRLLAGVADVYDQPNTAAVGGSGKTYFLNRLLGEVIFAEAGLVQLDPSARLRLRSRLTMALGGIAAITLLTLVLWGISTWRNMTLQDELTAQATEVQKLIKDRGLDMRQVSASDASFEEALPILDKLRTLSQGYADQQAGGPPLLMRFGLFQSGHATNAREAYMDALRRIMLPRLLLRSEAAIQENIANPMQVYEPLKVYLMLGGKRPGGIEKASVKSWVQNDWEAVSLAGPDRADTRKRLALHLDAMLGDTDLNLAWQNRTPPIDNNVVQAGRVALQNITIAQLAYAILRQKGMAQQGANWTAASILTGGDAVAFANPDAVLQLQVPYFFTRDGFEKVYQPGILTVQKNLEDDLWVLGQEANTSSINAQISTVRPGVAAAYATEYNAQWEGVVKAMVPAAYFSDLSAFGAFTKSPSPWKQMLLAVRKNTLFTGGTQAATNMAKNAITQRMGNAAQVMPTASAQTDAGTEITRAFKDLHIYVGDGTAAVAPIDQFIDAVRTAGQAVLAGRTATVGGAGDMMQSQMAQGTAGVQAAGATAPAMLQSFVSETAKGGSSAQTSAIQGAVSQAYATTVLPACQGVVQDRYPFFAAAPADADLRQVVQFFGNGSLMDTFVRDRLAKMMVTSGPVWRWNMDDPVAAALDPGSAEQFAETPLIRDLIVTGLPFKIGLVSLGGGADAVEFSAGASPQRLMQGDRSEKSMQWLPQASAPEAHIAFFTAGQEVDRLEQEGPWAIFRLVDSAPQTKSSDMQFVAKFTTRKGMSAALRFTISGTSNPFNRGGIWSFRCPATL
ncbi:type VI secretion system membrane subunit TssM [Novosphingobium sp.]|uniref:type VI secretion system membrane subunit TssM n=1 Tax=Novosphingobium sp. TaxID=1874826 RepID=UPI00286D7530|nr:type VI secretion system membrane subunit TssM [Novosphingobium sp.]